VQLAETAGHQGATAAAVPTTTAAIRRLDVTGTFCPLPILLAAREMLGMTAGDWLEIVGDDPAILEDMPVWCDRAGHRLVELAERGGKIVSVVEKGSGPPGSAAGGSGTRGRRPGSAAGAAGGRRRRPARPPGRPAVPEAVPGAERPGPGRRRPGQAAGRVGQAAAGREGARLGNEAARPGIGTARPGRGRPARRKSKT
jgi:tRNA 2-thiouridine synthesizing protein A